MGIPHTYSVWQATWDHDHVDRKLKPKQNKCRTKSRKSSTFPATSSEMEHSFWTDALNQVNEVMPIQPVVSNRQSFWRFRGRLRWDFWWWGLLDLLSSWCIFLSIIYWYVICETWIDCRLEGISRNVCVDGDCVGEEMTNNKRRQCWGVNYSLFG